jgi:hypothetical protein
MLRVRTFGLLALGMLAISPRPVAGETDAAWAVRFYDAADCNLQDTYRKAAKDLRNVPFAKTKLRMLLYFDRRTDGNLSGEPNGTADWSGAKQFLYEASGKLEARVPDAKEMNTCAEATFEEFVTWAPVQAAHNALVLRGHGTGYFGVLTDDHHTDSALPLRPAAIRRVLEKHSLQYDVVVLDSCGVGTLEMLEAFHGHAEYVVASEGDLNSESLDHVGRMKDLAGTPTTTPEALATRYVETYEAPHGIACGLRGLRGRVSVFDMQHFEAFWTALGEVGTLLEAVGGDMTKWLAFAKIREDCNCQQLRRYSSDPVNGLAYDLHRLLSDLETKGLAIHTDLPDRANTCREAFEDLVPCSSFGKDHEGYGGLAALIACSESSYYMTEFTKSFGRSAWGHFLEVYRNEPYGCPSVPDTHVCSCRAGPAAGSCPQAWITTDPHHVAAVYLSVGDPRSGEEHLRIRTRLTAEGRIPVEWDGQVLGVESSGRWIPLPFYEARALDAGRRVMIAPIWLNSEAAELSVVVGGDDGRLTEAFLFETGKPRGPLSAMRVPLRAGDRIHARPARAHPAFQSELVLGEATVVTARTATGLGLHLTVIQVDGDVRATPLAR